LLEDEEEDAKFSEEEELEEEELEEEELEEEELDEFVPPRVVFGRLNKSLLKAVPSCSLRSTLLKSVPMSMSSSSGLCSPM
jgi:hypothetical protein